MNATDFAIFLTNACTNHQAGFYYYDHGFVGMALALHEEFERRGLHPSLHIRLDVDHVYAYADNHFVDGQGRGRPEDQRGGFLTREASREAVVQWAKAKGATDDEIESDLDTAREIVASAVELHSDYVKALAGFCERYGIDLDEAEDLYWILQDETARPTLFAIAADGFTGDRLGELRARPGLMKTLAVADGSSEDMVMFKEEIERYGVWVFFERFGKGETFSGEPRLG